MTIFSTRITLPLLFFCLLLAPSQATSDLDILARVDTQETGIATSISVNTPPATMELKPLELAPLKVRLLKPADNRRDTFGNSRVDLAPKSWPYPMVVSPARPVLPGTAW